MDIARLTLPQRITAGAMLVVVIAAFLPWVSVFGIGVSGIRGDGVITLLLALAGLAVLAVTTGLVGGERTPTRASEIAIVVLGGIVALIGLFDLNSYGAIGLYLTLLGGLAWVGCAVWQVLLSQKAAAGGGSHTEV